MKLWALLLLALLAPPLAAAPPIAAGTVYAAGSDQCFELYFVNAIYFINSSGVFQGFLETPVNYTSPPYRQEVHVIYLWGNATFNSSEEAVQLSAGNGTAGGFVARIRICGRGLGEAYEILKKAFRNPAYGKEYDSRPIPSNVSKKYLLKPMEVVAEKVKPEFEKWLRREKGVEPGEMSRISLAVDAAYFIYAVFIEYSPSALPRTMEQVIESRRGDCDDMSRILVNLLWSYGIPAKIAQGYVYLNLSMQSPVGRSLYIFRDAGPHAFVMAYVPGFGWVSLDFLAGSMIIYPFIFEGETVYTNITEQQVEEVVEMHRRHVFVQMMSILGREEFEKLSLGGRDLSRVALWAMSRIMARAAELSGVGGGVATTVTRTRTVTVTLEPAGETRTITVVVTRVTTVTASPVRVTTTIARTVTASGRTYVTTVPVVTTVVKVKPIKSLVTVERTATVTTTVSTTKTITRTVERSSAATYIPPTLIVAAAIVVAAVIYRRRS